MKLGTEWAGVVTILLLKTVIKFIEALREANDHANIQFSEEEQRGFRPFMLLTSENCFLHLVAVDNYLVISPTIHFPVDVFFNCWWALTSHVYSILICWANTQRFLCIRPYPRHQKKRQNTTRKNILYNICILTSNCYTSIRTYIL